MRKLLLLFISVFTCFIVQAQHVVLPETTIDSRDRDSMKIHAILKSARSMVDFNTDSALVMLKESANLSRKIQYNDGLALSLMEIGVCFAVKSNHHEAFQYLNLAKPYLERSSDREKLLLQWYRTQFIAYKFMGYSDSSLLSLQRALELLAKGNDTFEIISIYNLLGSAWIDNQNYENALNYINKAKTLNRYENTHLLVSYLNLCYINLENKDTAALYANAFFAFEVAKKLNYPRFERTASAFLVKYYLMKGEDQIADYYAKNAISLLDDNAFDSHVNIYRLLSKFYSEQGKYSIALEYGTRALRKIKAEHRNRRDFVELYKELSDIHIALGNDAQAYEFLLTYNQYSDSINFVERAKAVDKLERQYYLAEKDRQILQQEAKVRKRDIWIVSVSAGIIIAISLSVLFLTLYRASKRKMNLLEQQKELNELKAMVNGEERERNRMAKELHDGVGGLLSAATQNLSAMKEENIISPLNYSYQKVEFLIKEISNEVRRTAHNLMPDILLKNSLEEAIVQFCSYVKKDKQLEISVQTRGDFSNFDQQFKLSIYRIVQELVQNIVKHAKATSAFVQIQKSKNLLTITVEDNGVGYDTKIEYSGLGLNSIQERINAFNGTISVSSSVENGTSVYIEFDLDKN